jgi:hypothetical protein
MLLDKILENCQNVKQKDLKKMYNSLFSYDDPVSIVVDGDGRSYLGGVIGTHKLTYLPGVRIYGAHEPYLPGKNVAEAFENLGKTCKKLVYLTVSYSGETSIPLANLKLIEQIAKEKHIDVNLITGPSESSMRDVVNNCEGNILELKGRESKKTTGERYLKEGILEDLFELEATKILSIISMGISGRKSEEEFYEFYKEKLDELKNFRGEIQKLQELPHYKGFLEVLSNPYKNFISCGQGPDDPVVKINNIRLRQLRPLTVQKLGSETLTSLNIGTNQNYVIGESDCSNMDSNSIFLGVTESGKSAKVKKYLIEATEAGAERFIITKNGTYEIEMFKLRTEDFYSDTCIVLSQALTDLGELLLKQGLKIDESMLRKIHLADKGVIK